MSHLCFHLDSRLCLTYASIWTLTYVPTYVPASTAACTLAHTSTAACPSRALFSVKRLAWFGSAEFVLEQGVKRVAYRMYRMYAVRSAGKVSGANSALQPCGFLYVKSIRFARLVLRSQPCAPGSVRAGRFL